MSAGDFPMVFKGAYLRLKVLEQNLQLYGRSPESMMPISESCEESEKDPKTSGSAREREREETHAVAGAATDGLCAGTSFHIDCRSIGFEPPS
jgi:hypothetical protein